MVIRLPVFASMVWLAVCFAPATADAAESNSIRVFAGGENYQGPPIMRIKADGSIIAVVPVTNALKSPVEDLTEKSVTESLRPYEFMVPSLNKVQVLTIEFTNDAWSGSAAMGVRNLWIGSVTAGSTKFASGQLKVAGNRARRLGSMTILGSNDMIEIVRPKGGWSTVEAVKKEPSCAGRTILTGYATNQTTPSLKDAARLTEAFAKISDLARCKLTIMVTTSPDSSAAANASVAGLRAEAVMAIALKAGAEPKRISVAKPKDGKRSVLISISP